MAARPGSDAPNEPWYQHYSKEGEPHMVLDGVLVDDRVVRELAAIVDRPLGQKLERALFFSAEIVALTREEKAAVMTALNRDDWEFRDVRERLLIGARQGEVAEQA